MKTKLSLFWLLAAIFFSCQKEVVDTGAPLPAASDDYASAGYQPRLDTAVCTPAGFFVTAPGALITDAWNFFPVPDGYALNGATFHAKEQYDLALYGTPVAFAKDGSYWYAGLHDLHIPLTTARSLSFEFALKDNVASGTLLADTLWGVNYIKSDDEPLEYSIQSVSGLQRMAVQSKPTVALYTPMQKMHRGGIIVAGISIKADPNGAVSITQIPLKVTLLNVKTKMNLADAQLVSLATGSVVSQKITAKSTGEGSWNLSIKCADLMVAAGSEEKFLLVKPYRTTGMAAIGVALGDKDKFSWNDGQKTFTQENTRFLSDADYSGNVYRTNF